MLPKPPAAQKGGGPSAGESSSHHRRLSLRASHVTPQQQLQISSWLDLESRYSLELLRHASGCVGLDYHRDVEGVSIKRQYPSLRDVPKSTFVRTLEPHVDHEDDVALLQRYVDEGATASQQNTSFSSVPSGTGNLSSGGGNGAPLPLNVMKTAEVALRRYNQHNSAQYMTLHRVLHACEQLRRQQQRSAAAAAVENSSSASRTTSREGSPSRSDEHHSSTTSATHAAAAASGTLISHKQNNNEESGDEMNEAGGGGVRAAEVDEMMERTAAALDRLRRRAIAERDHLLRVEQIEAKIHASDSQQRQRRPVSASGRVPPALLLEERRKRAFDENLAAHQELSEKKRKQEQEQKQLQRQTLAQLANSLRAAEERRLSFLESRERSLRQQDANRSEGVATALAKKESAIEEKRRKLQEKNHNAGAHGNSSSSSSAAFSKHIMTPHEEEVYRRAERIASSRSHRAAESEKMYGQRCASLDERSKLDEQRREEEAQRRQAHRDEAKKRAAELEQLRIADTVLARQLIEEHHAMRQQYRKMQREIRAEERALRDTQHKQLSEQFARARAYREVAFRQQWELELETAKQRETEKEEIRKSLHQVVLAKERELKQIVHQPDPKTKKKMNGLPDNDGGSAEKSAAGSRKNGQSGKVDQLNQFVESIARQIQTK